MKKLIIAGLLTALVTACTAAELKATKTQLNAAADEFCRIHAQVKDYELGEAGPR